VPSRSRQSNAQKPENKALIVLLSALQLTAMIVVWLLAIVPAALMALAVLLWKGLQRLSKRADGPSPHPTGPRRAGP
jgi:hypothetical protein